MDFLQTYCCLRQQLLLLSFWLFFSDCFWLPPPPPLSDCFCFLFSLFLLLSWKLIWAKTSTVSKIYQPKLSWFHTLRKKRISSQSREDPREHFLLISMCRTLYARLIDFCLLDSGTEGLDMLGEKVCLKDGPKPHCTSQRKERLFIFLIVLQYWWCFDCIWMWWTWSRCVRPVSFSDYKVVCSEPWTVW